MLRLAPDRPGPGQPQPGQVIGNGGLEFGPAAARIDVLDAEEELPPGPRRPGREQRRIGVADMQQARGAGRKAG